MQSTILPLCAERERAAGVITQKTGLQVSEAEIGYLAMHFGAAKEKIESRRRKK